MSLDLLSSATATEPWKELASFWGGLSHAVRGISGPVATLSLPADATRARLLDAMKEIIVGKSAYVGRLRQ